MQPLIEPHRRQLRDMLEEKMPPEGADAVLAALPASEADMPATKDFVRAEIRDLRVEMTEKFATADANTQNLRVEIRDTSASMKRWVIGTGIGLATMMTGLAGVALAAANTISA